MSERRQLQNHLTEAAIRLDDVIAELREAIDYLNGYSFLDEANPMLQRRLVAQRGRLRLIRDDLWNKQVKS